MATSRISASTPEEQPPGAKAREDVEFLVAGIESEFDCEISLDSLVTRLDATAGHFTVFVRLDGGECEEAFRALKLRSKMWPFSFISLSQSEGKDVKNRPKDDT